MSIALRPGPTPGYAPAAPSVAPVADLGALALPPHAAPDVAVACAECAEPLHGPFCHACGQPQAREDDLTLGRFVRAAFHEVSGLDGRLVRTLVALVRHPGQLTREFVVGHRRRWVNPLQLFLLVSAAFVLCNGWRALNDQAQARAQMRQMAHALAHFRDERAHGHAHPAAPATPPAPSTRVSGTSAPVAATPTPSARAAGTGHAAVDADVARIDDVALDRALDRYVDWMDWAKLPMAAVTAAIVWLVQRKRATGGLTHVVFTLHHTTFAFLFGLVLVPIFLAAPRLFGAPIPPWVILVSFPVSIAYLYAALRTAYGEPRGRAARRALLIFALDTFATLSVSSAAMVLAVARATA